MTMQTALFEVGQYVATAEPGVRAEHAECEADGGFVWESQATFFQGVQAICSRCGTVRPYETKADVATDCIEGDSL